MMNYRKITLNISDWLADYMDESELEGWVIGVSGGVDSAVAATLAAETAYPVICLNMPIHQAKDQLSRADEQIDWLTNKYEDVCGKTVDLTGLFDCALSSIPKDGRSKLADANTASRLRMLTLYSYAAANKSMVVGTGNKVEDHGVGFFTKYGDGGVDISPIADLTKTEVRNLARHLGIPDSVINAIPTDGLWEDDRSDEEQIGATYAELEWAMSEHDLQKGDEECLDWKVFSERESEVMKIYLHRHKTSRHKLSLPPVYVLPR